MNKQGNHLHEAPPSLAAAADRDCDIFIILHTDAWMIPLILALRPKARFILRIYHPSIMERPIDEWVATCKWEWAKWGRYCICLIPANELNLAREHGIREPPAKREEDPGRWDRFWREQAYWESKAGYEAQRDWWLSFIRRWGNQGPLGVLGLSPGHSEDSPDLSWSGYEILRPVVEHPQATYLVVHAYWLRRPSPSSLCWGLFPGQDEYWHAFRPLRPRWWKNVNQPDKAVAPDPGGAMAIFPNKPILITEANRVWKRGDSFDERAVAEEWEFFFRRYAALPQVKCIAWYQEAGPDGQGVETFDIAANPHLAYKMKTMDKDIPEGGATMELSEAQKHQIRDQVWRDCGSEGYNPKTGLAKWAVGMGLDPPAGPEHYEVPGIVYQAYPKAHNGVLIYWKATDKVTEGLYPKA